MPMIGIYFSLIPLGYIDMQVKDKMIYFHFSFKCYRGLLIKVAIVCH